MKKRDKKLLSATTQNTAELEAEVGGDPMVVIKRRNPITMLWRAFLFIVRIPEKTLGTIYRYSPIRMILYKMEWYRDLADQTQIETILEDTYGGASTRLMRLRHFIRKNILFTTLFCIGVYFAGINLVPKVLHHPTVRMALGQPLIDADSRIEEIQNTRQTSQAILARRGDLRVELEHCAVLDDTRLQLLSMLNSDARFSEPEAASSMDVIRRFTSHIDELDLRVRMQAADGRYQKVRSALTLANDRFGQALSELDRRENQLRSEIDNLRYRKLALDEAGGVSNINESIKLRDEIDRRSLNVDAGPTRADLNEATSRVQHLKDQLNLQSTATIVSRLERIEPTWMRIAVESEGEQLQTVIEEQESRVNGLVDRLRSSSRSEVATSVLDVSSVLEEFSIVQQRASQLASGLQQKLVRRQQTANQQISSFMNDSSTQWVDYEACNINRVAAD